MVHLHVDQQKRKRVIKSAKRLGCDGTDLQDLFDAETSRKATKIMEDTVTDHPLQLF